MSEDATDGGGAEAPEVEQMSFEAAMKALEQVVDRLESGDAPLEEAIGLYERGAKLKAHCQSKLDDAEMKVRRITEGPDGDVTAADA